MPEKNPAIGFDGSAALAGAGVTTAVAVAVALPNGFGNDGNDGNDLRIGNGTGTGIIGFFFNFNFFRMATVLMIFAAFTALRTFTPAAALMASFALAIFNGTATAATAAIFAALACKISQIGIYSIRILKHVKENQIKLDRIE